MDKKAIIEGLKSVGRVAIFAAIGAALTYVTDLPQNSTTIVVLIVLKFADSYVHNNDNIKANGIIPF